MTTEFEKTLAVAIAWLLDNGTPDPLAMSKYLVASGVVADPAEIERLGDTEKAQGVMIRELERLNTELNNELGTAVQVLKLERDALRGQVAAVGALLDKTEPKWRHKGCWLTTQTVLAVDLRAALDEPTSSEPQSEPKFDAPGPDPDGGVDLTDEEFAAFLKAAKS